MDVYGYWMVLQVLEALIEANWSYISWASVYVDEYPSQVVLKSFVESSKTV